MNIQEVHNYLKAHHVKPSIQRTAVMQYLLEHVDHPDVDRIYCALVPSMPTLSKTTVYNTLKLLHEKNAVKMLYIDERNVRYDGHTHVHGHFKCKLCYGIYDIMLDVADFPPCRDNSGLVVEETQIYFLGKCKNCA